MWVRARAFLCVRFWRSEVVRVRARVSMRVRGREMAFSSRAVSVTCRRSCVKPIGHVSTVMCPAQRVDGHVSHRSIMCRRSCVQPTIEQVRACVWLCVCVVVCVRECVCIRARACYAW